MSTWYSALWRRFQEHPASVGESYGEHARHAAQFAWLMLCGAVACFIHAVLPWLHTSTASRTVLRLHDRMITNRDRMRQNSASRLEPATPLSEHK